jgi:hypothetical protein
MKSNHPSGPGPAAFASRSIGDWLVPIACHVVVGAYVIAALWAAVAGVAGFVGPIVAAAVVIFLLFQRFTPPLALVVFVGATTAWHWHWLAALFFAGQSLVLLGQPVLSGLLLLEPDGSV